MPNNKVAPPPSRETEIARLTLSQLPAATPLATVLQYVCQIAAAVIRVERVGVWFFEQNDTILKCVNQYELSRGVHSSGVVLNVNRIPNYVASLCRRRSLPVEMVSSMPWTEEVHRVYCEPLGITSMLDSGIFHGGSLVGVVCLEHVGPPRDWSTDERDFAAALADFVGSRLPTRLTSRKIHGIPTTKVGTEQELVVALQDSARNIVSETEEFLSYLEACSTKSGNQNQMFMLALGVLNSAQECVRLASSLRESPVPTTTASSH